MARTFLWIQLGVVPVVILTFGCVFSSCKARQDYQSALKVVGGTAAGERFPEVIKLQTKTHCTGSFVGPLTVLTARHCIWSLNLAVEDYRTRFVVVTRNPEFDIALVTLAGPPRTKFLRISDRTPKVTDEKVTLIGFGYTTLDESDTQFNKTYGYNTVDKVERNLIFVSRDESKLQDANDISQAILGGGDSGGPLLGSDGRIVGVNSASDGRLSSRFVDMTAPSVKTFLQQAMALDAGVHIPGITPLKVSAEDNVTLVRDRRGGYWVERLLPAFANKVNSLLPALKQHFDSLTPHDEDSWGLRHRIGVHGYGAIKAEGFDVLTTPAVSLVMKGLQTFGKEIESRPKVGYFLKKDGWFINYGKDYYQSKFPIGITMEDVHGVDAPKIASVLTAMNFSALIKVYVVAAQEPKDLDDISRLGQVELKLRVIFKDGRVLDL